MADILPEAFIASTCEMLGDECNDFVAALESSAPVSVRWNPYKIEQKPDGMQVPWNRYGRYLPERPSFTLDPVFHAGAYYVQEASSMFVEHLVRYFYEEPRGLRILDLCAAPGGKSTLYSTLAGPEGIVVANEVVRNRAMALTDNVIKWGIGNVIVSNNDPSHFAGLPEWFDVVAVDAPCSGEGMFRKIPEARQEWSEESVQMCATRQRKILSDVWDALRPGGILIYSTCTFNKQENEDNVRWMADNFDCEDAGVEVSADWGVVQTEAGGIRCFRFFPHKVAGEGFFAAALIKSGQKGRTYRPRARKPIFADVSRQDVAELSRWVGQPEFFRFARIADTMYGYYADTYPDIKSISEYLNTIHSGVCMGQMFGGKLKPDHSLAMFHDINTDAVNVASVDVDNAIRYLRKDDAMDISSLTEGFNLMSFDGHPLGFAKRIASRANNLYPKSLTILKK